MQSVLALHPPIASLDLPRGRVAIPDDLFGRGARGGTTTRGGNLQVLSEVSNSHLSFAIEDH